MSVVRTGSEILVNAATVGQQDNPRIATLSNGSFVVTWQDASQGVGGTAGDGSSSAVKAQLFGADGGKSGAEILVNTATLNAQSAQQITALAGGGFVVTWRDASLGTGGATGDLSGSAVKVQVFTASGAPTGSEILVNTATLFDQGAPQITALSNGGFVVTWEDVSQGTGGTTGDLSGTAVKAQVFTAAGAPAGSEILVNTATFASQAGQQIIALSNGGFVVSWQDGSAGAGGATADTSQWAVKAQVFTAAGAPAGSEILVNTATANVQSFQQMTALANGGFVVTWQDFSRSVGGASGDGSEWAVKAQVFAVDGSAAGAEILVNTAIQSSQILPQIAALTDGGFVVVWEDASQGTGGATGDTSGSAVKAQLFTAAALRSVRKSWSTPRRKAPSSTRRSWHSRMAASRSRGRIPAWVSAARPATRAAARSRRRCSRRPARGSVRKS